MPWISLTGIVVATLVCEPSGSWPPLPSRVFTPVHDRRQVIVTLMPAPLVGAVKSTPQSGGLPGVLSAPAARRSAGDVLAGLLAVIALAALTVGVPVGMPPSPGWRTGSGPTAPAARA
jgi:hypothetical protein